jgi:hypothetical protein
MFNLKTVQGLAERKNRLESNPAISNLKAKLTLCALRSNILLKTYIQSIITLSLDDLSSKYKSIEINTDIQCSAVDKGESDLQTLNNISISGSDILEKFKLPALGQPGQRGRQE